jgi:hypothetical protein
LRCKPSTLSCNHIVRGKGGRKYGLAHICSMPYNGINYETEMGTDAVEKTDTERVAQGGSQPTPTEHELLTQLSGLTDVEQKKIVDQVVRQIQRGDLRQRAA